MSLLEYSAPCLAVRGSKGLCLQKPTDYTIHPGFTPDESKTCKAFQFSPDGSRLAWSNMSTVQIATQKDAKWTVSTIPQAKVYALQWSPLSSLLATWEQYGSAPGQEPKPNLHLWDTATGEIVKSFFQKKFGGWAPVWNSDESICSRMVNNEIQFYANNDFSAILHKLHIQKVTHYGMSTNAGKTFVVGYAPGSKGGPSFAKLFQYPNFEDTQVLANKSFFQADSVDVKWNSSGTCVLLLVQADVDKTGSSYYGKQQLHFMNIRGDTCMVSLAKEGPIYSVSWSPKGDVFAVVHGFMPAKTALFNDKGNQVFDFGTGPKNLAMFNPQSNLLMVGGFGNLRGKIDMWDVSRPDNISKGSLVSSFEAPDTTDVKWSPDGQHIVTTTCAPRLRQGNGYKIWHYSGSLIHEKAFANTDELWEGDWQGAAPGTFGPFKVSKQQVQGIQPSQPQVSKQVYRPPGARGTPSTFKLHDDEDAVGKVVDGQNRKKDGTQPENLSKTAQKNKKRREAAKKKRDEEEAAGIVSNGGAANNANHPPADNSYKGAAGLLFDPEKEKKMKKLRDKLASIETLKAQQAEGKTLEKNQLEKLSREKELLDELAKLSV